MSRQTTDDATQFIQLKDSKHGEPEAQDHKEQRHAAPAWEKCFGFGLLAFPTVASLFLLIRNYQQWKFSGSAYTTIIGERAAVQVVVQILANALALAQVLVVCRLINYTTRIWLAGSTASLDAIGFWAALSTSTMDWRLPVRMVLPLLAFCGLSPLLSAIWVGALTPVPAVGFRDGTAYTPDWSNMTFIAEYPSEIDQTGPNICNSKGCFTYSVGVGLLTPLVSSASSATTADGSVRSHFKLDNTGFTYYGRSYGVGSAVGLSSDSLLEDDLATGYSYLEVGYDASVSCVYNQTSLFVLERVEKLLFAAAGPLPDSDGEREYSVYFGRNDRAIIAAGVSHVHQASGPRYVAVTAGSYYEALNSTQCAIDFNPALFEVSVNFTNSGISVKRVSDASEFDQSRNLTHVATRQIELISNTLTGLYRSPLGDAFNASISNYAISKLDSPNPPSREDATLAGLTNSISSLIDDILGSYAAAQVIIGKFTTATPAKVQFAALRLGEEDYIITIFVVNSVVIALVLIESIRTKGWRTLHIFDYTDLRSLATASALGGADSRVSLDKITGKKERGKMSVKLGTTEYPDEFRHFQITLGKSQVGARRISRPGNGYQQADSSERLVRTWSSNGV